jgi:hypothetical protein
MIDSLSADVFNTISSAELEDLIAETMSLSLTGHITYCNSANGVRVLHISMKRKRDGNAD